MLCQIFVAPSCPASRCACTCFSFSAFVASAGSVMPTAGARRNTHCCEKYSAPTPASPDHSSTAAAGL